MKHGSRSQVRCLADPSTRLDLTRHPLDSSYKSACSLSRGNTRYKAGAIRGKRISSCSAMSSHQEKTNETVSPVPDVTVLTDSEGEDEVVDLEAMARAATAKLEKDLAEAKTQNERIARKKQERADRLRHAEEERGRGREGSPAGAG